MTNSNNVDPNEINKFSALAEQWWDPNGPMRPLHQLNPLRLSFVSTLTALRQQAVLDVGCGAGIFSEALAGEGARVTGIDMSEPALNAAKSHASEPLTISYQLSTAEAFALQHAKQFAVVTCMEMLEHVPDPSTVIQACSDCCADDGLIVFSTLNRHWQAFLLAIVGAEYILNLLPKGTHEYAKFIKPSELTSMANRAGLELVKLQGISYHPLSQTFKFADNVNVNYLAAFRKHT